MTQNQLNLKGFFFQELFHVDGLKRLDREFLAYLQALDELSYGKMIAYREGQAYTAEEESNLLIEVAAVLEAFIAELFNIELPVGQLQAKTLHHDPVFLFKRHFIQREAKRALSRSANLPDFAELNQWLMEKVQELRLFDRDIELAVARFAQRLLDDSETYQVEINKLIDWCVSALTSAEGKAFTHHWVSFQVPNKLNYENLVSIEAVTDDPYGRLQGPPNKWRQRDGFKLTDPRMDARRAMNEVHYCVYCHKTEGDFCSKGFPVKKNAPELGLKTNPVGEILTGCPLDEKISEMHVLKRDGYSVAALAMVMVDNPMCPATGHRICNDCMKACIYQKQDPVNIPQTETRILTDVLHLPWGVEIYDLLTRWNPLRRQQYVAKPYNGLKILVMGMGPSGFTLAHHLLMEGFAVVGTDGLKIEPLPKKYLEQPIYAYQDLVEGLDNRVMSGFGGVAEYGITVRWDKNFLKLIYISLMRRPYFQVFGSVRFGGTLKVADAWRLGFNHLAVCVGAGLPRELMIPHSLAPGMRQANDFLMTLQLTGAAKKSSLANLQVRLPALVIGGGLTGIDTATEVQAYYLSQIEKFCEQYGILSTSLGEQALRAHFDAQSLTIVDEFLTHAQQLKTERQQALNENRQPNLIKLLRGWGGVTIIYRRSMQESPAYKRNHEEIINAFEEGIYYAEGIQPKAVILDEFGAVKALTCDWHVLDEEGNWMLTDEQQILPARSIFVATGAQPNVAYEFENQSTFIKEGRSYQQNELRDNLLYPVSSTTNGHVKMDKIGVFTSYQLDHKRVSFLGDTHPVFHGSVVKAIASAKRAYPKITELLVENNPLGDPREYQEFHSQMEFLFCAKVRAISRISSKVVELKVQAPMSAHNFGPGQFFRLQNYECLSTLAGQTRLQTEALALLGTPCDGDSDCLSFIVVEDGVSSRLVSTFKEGEHISIMGPTGARTKIPKQPENFMIVGGYYAIAYLFSHAQALREAGHRILFVGYFEQQNEFIYQEKIATLADHVLWVNAKTTASIPAEMQVASGSEYFPGDEETSREKIASCSQLTDVVTALREYAIQDNAPIPLSAVDQIHIVGEATLLRTLQQARQAVLKEYLKDGVKFVAAVYGPMQCMLKGVCAQCLQWQVDPATGKRSKAVYACSWQHQPLEKVDIGNIDERLAQNRVQEIMSNLWLDYLFVKYQVARV